MSVEVAPLEREEEDHDVLPFRLRDISPVFAFSDLYPIAKPLDRIQSELKFQTKLAVREWNSEY